MSIYSESMSNTPELELDLKKCETCDFECGTIGYCLNECGANYIVSKLLHAKGYGQCNMDSVLTQTGFVWGLELYNNEARKFAENMEQLGYSCWIHKHPLGKKYLSTVVVDGYDPIDLCLDFLELQVIK